MCGVRQFTATPEKIVLPKWMFKTLNILPFDLIEETLLCCPSLPYAKSLVLKPVNDDFNISLLDNETRKAVLEISLKRYSAVKLFDTIPIEYNGVHHLSVVRAKPNDCLDITECDVDISFDIQPVNELDGRQYPDYYENNTNIGKVCSS